MDLEGKLEPQLGLRPTGLDIFFADDSLSADKLDPEEPSLPTEGGMVSLVEILTLLARARNFPFSTDLAGSRHASISKLDVRPGEVESRLIAKK